MDNELQRRRDENLERNRLFFENLLGKPELICQTEVLVDKNGTVGPATLQSQFEISQLLHSFDDDCEYQHFNALLKYPDKKRQVNILFGHLRNNPKCAPALICIGESGTSKADIVRATFCHQIEKVSFPFCIVPCYGYSNAQQVIRYIWFEFRASVREKCIELFGPGGNLRLGNDTERPSKFSHLCASMNKLMVAAFGFSSSPSDRGVGAGVEEETEEVSSTSSSSSRHVYFHLVLERVDSIGSLDGDDPQHSVMSKLLQLSTHAHPHIKVVATCRSAVWGSNLPNAMTVTFPPLEESVSRALLLSRLDGIVTASLRDSTVSEDAKQAVAEAMSVRVNQIMAEIFIHLRVVSRHLPTLCRLFESVWSRMFKCSLVDSTRNLLEMCKISGNLLSLDSALSTSLKPVPALTAALSLPVYGLLLEDGADERVLGRFSADWRRNPGWCEQLSRRVRYVLMACFIASNNPAESDLMKLTEAQSGRRKKQRFGVDTSAADASSSSSAVSLSSLSGRSALPSRCFSLERLHGIFCLMVTAGQGGCATDSMFGDSGLNSTIRDLVEQRVLDAAPNWTLTAPQYTSSVSYVTALEAARSVGLRLSDYLMGNDSAYPL